MTTESQHKAPPAGLAGTVDHHDAGDGWLLVRLMTKQALLREGLHMDHCLQDGCYQEYAGEEKLTGDAIWSLRDPAGVSWATVEVRASRVIMANGPGARDVRRSAARRLQALVMAFRAAGTDLDFNGETDLVMADDGRVMREDQAPAEVREQSRARHAARVDAQRDRLPGCAMRFPAYPPERSPEQELIAATANLPNPIVEIDVRQEFNLEGLNVPGFMVRATFRNGETAHMGAETRGTLMRALSLRIQQFQPPQSAGVGNPRRGNVLELSSEPISDVVFTVAGEALREGDDYCVDAARGAVEFKRDVDGQVEVAYRITFDPNRRVLTLGMDTQDGPIPCAIPWSLEPLTSDRVTVEDAAHAREMAEALRAGARGFPQSPRYRLVQSLSGRPVVLGVGPLG